MDLQQVAAELYAADPDGFTARRGELAAQARQQGDADLATEVAALRRPTVAAWVVNRLVLAEDSADVDDLVELGDQLRAAQSGLDGARIRELTRQRQQLVARLVKLARELATREGQQLSAAVQRELEETFGAAVADEQAGLAVTSGRLTRALAYAGMGEVDVTAATATPLGSARRERPQRRARPEPAQPGYDPDGARRTAADKAAAAEEAVAAARSAVEAADADADAAQRARERAEQAEVHATDRLDELQRAVVQARRDLGSAGKAVEAAKREHLRRQQAAREARAQLRQAERRT